MRMNRERRDEAIIDAIIEAVEELKRLDRKLDEHASVQTFHAFQRIFGHLKRARELVMEGHGE